MVTKGTTPVRQQGRAPTRSQTETWHTDTHPMCMAVSAAVSVERTSKRMSEGSDVPVGSGGDRKVPLGMIAILTAAALQKATVSLIVGSTKKTMCCMYRGEEKDRIMGHWVFPFWFQPNLLQVTFSKYLPKEFRAPSTAFYSSPTQVPSFLKGPRC